MPDYPGVIIDACIPRSDYERVQLVMAYLEGITPEDKKDEIVDIRVDAHNPRIVYYGYFTEIEDDIINKINEFLPDEYVCTVGEANPGDVIVREVGDDDEEQGLMGERS